MTDDLPLKATIDLNFPSKKIAGVVHDVLRIDKEPKNTITKDFVISDNCLQVIFTGTSARHLRVAVNAFFDNVNLIIETIDIFEQDKA